MRVILISGKARSGKNTVADMIRDMLGHRHVRNEAFARPLKEMCVKAYEPIMKFLENRYRNHDDDELLLKPDNFFEKKTALSRLILQVTGTEIVRTVDPLYWIDQTILNINTLFMTPSVRFVTVSDWRFPNEYEQINLSFPHAIRIRIVNKNIATSADEHVSENALDDPDFGFDYTIQNDSSLDKLRIEVAKMIDTIIEEDML